MNRHSTHRLLPVLMTCACSAAAQPPDAGRTLQEQNRPALTLPDPQQNAPLELQAPAVQPLTAPGARVTLRQFRITGAMVTADNGAELLRLFDDARGQSFDLAGMEALAARVTRYYRERGYLFARAYLPPQEIRNGTLQIAVIEGRYFHVDVHNASKVTGITVNLWPGQAIEAPALERSLLLLSDIPGITVRSTLKPGKQVGTSDLLIDIAPGRSVIGSIDLDNHGNHYTGEFRGGGSLVFNNPTHAGDQLYLRANTAGEGMIFGAINYLRPVGNDGGRVGATYAHVYYSLGSDFEFLDAHGTADILSVYTQYPFVRSRRFNFNAQLGLTEKRLRDDIGLFDSVTRKSVDSAALTLSGNSSDALLGGGSNSFSAALTGGRVRFADREAEAIDRATAQSAGGYATLGLNALRSQRLTDSLSLYTALSAQFTTTNLVSSEKFSLGGPYGVRAYPQGEATGDEGQLLSIELRQALSRTWQLVGFVDGGRVSINKDPWNDDDNSRTLSGYGIGCHWNSRFGLTLRASLAWKLGSEKPTSDDDRSPRAWVQLTQYF